MTSVQLEPWRGDITTLAVDAIVNAANEDLYPGGGVCGAIHAAAGAQLARECRGIGHCASGQAVVTGAYDLNRVKWIIHAVGPIYDGTSASAEVLGQVYTAIVNACETHDVESVAIPCISTGIYGYPKRPAADIAVRTIRRETLRAPRLHRVTFVCYGADDFEIYSDLLR